MTIAYFDCFSGAGGDMIVASLLDAGANEGILREGLGALSVDGYSLSIEKITKQGFAATKFNVQLDKQLKQPHRHLHNIVDILGASRISDSVKEKATRVFTKLAEAEAAVHGCSIEKVHFHEVGAVDAIVDVVGAVLALEQLDVTKIVCSAIPTGSGTVKCDHGIMPIPAPATAELLKGIPIAECDETGELITPTAAAILTTLAESFGPMPQMKTEKIGYGAGTRDGQSRPNVLRVMIGESISQENVGSTNENGANQDSAVLLETNVDDCSPEIVGYCMERLLESGALDVYAQPIQMKKTRPGLLLSVLCKDEQVGEMERILFAETSTLGIRRRNVQRTVMQRRIESVSTPYGEIRMKVGCFEDIETVNPEYEDCKKAALEHKVPLRVVMEAARTAYQK